MLYSNDPTMSIEDLCLDIEISQQLRLRAANVIADAKLGPFTVVVIRLEVSPCLRRERVRPFAQLISDLRHLSLLLVHEAERTSLAMWL